MKKEIFVLGFGQWIGDLWPLGQIFRSHTCNFHGSVCLLFFTYTSDGVYLSGLSVWNSDQSSKIEFLYVMQCQEKEKIHEWSSECHDDQSQKNPSYLSKN